MANEGRETLDDEKAASTEEPDDEQTAEIVAGAESVDEAELENVSGGSDFGWWNEPVSTLTEIRDRAAPLRLVERTGLQLTEIRDRAAPAEPGCGALYRKRIAAQGFQAEVSDNFLLGAPAQNPVPFSMPIDNRTPTVRMCLRARKADGAMVGTAWSPHRENWAGLWPASRGSAKPALMTLRQASVRAAPFSWPAGCADGPIMGFLRVGAGTAP